MWTGLPLLLLCALPRPSSGADSENGVSETPLVECMSERIQMSVKTAEPFRGRIYLKGNSRRPECVTDFSQFEAPDDKDFSVAIDYNLCNTDRIRTLSPNGVTYANTVIVQFHDKFITQGDKAYHIRCFYSEIEKTVTSNFDVSGIPTGSLEYDMEMPSCEYTVRRETSNGPLVRSAQVGDVVFHRWECSGNMEVFGILVHSCYVENPEGEKDIILDQRGCSLESRLLPALTYSEDLSLAYARTAVFKYPDNSFVHFRCQIRVCTKIDSNCRDISPPRCETDEDLQGRLGEKRRRRGLDMPSYGATTKRNTSHTLKPMRRESSLSNIRRSLVEAGLDVVTNDILVIGEGDGGDEAEAQLATEAAPVVQSAAGPSMCLSKATLVLIMGGFALFFTTALACIVFLVVKKREKSTLANILASSSAVPPMYK